MSASLLADAQAAARAEYRHPASMMPGPQSRALSHALAHFPVAAGPLRSQPAPVPNTALDVWSRWSQAALDILSRQTLGRARHIVALAHDGCPSISCGGLTGTGTRPPLSRAQLITIASLEPSRHTCTNNRAPMFVPSPAHAPHQVMTRTSTSQRPPCSHFYARTNHPRAHPSPPVVPTQY